MWDSTSGWHLQPTSASPSQTPADTDSSLPPTVSPTSLMLRSLCSLQSTQATAEPCLPQETAHQPPWMSLMQNLPAAMPSSIQLSTHGEGERVQTKLEPQQQLEQDQAMFIFPQGWNNITKRPLKRQFCIIFSILYVAPDPNWQAKQSKSFLLQTFISYEGPLYVRERFIEKKDEKNLQMSFLPLHLPTYSKN